MTITQAIKKYNLIKQDYDCFGEKHPTWYECFTADKETETASYHYTLDRDKSFIDAWYLTVQTFYKLKNKYSCRVYPIDKEGLDG